MPAFSLVKGKQGPAVLNNKKQEIEKYFVVIDEHLKNLKTCRDAYLGLFLPTPIKEYPIHLVTQSL
jgi:hypothetical protein